MSCTCMIIQYSMSANHQIWHQATSKKGSHPGDYKRPLLIFIFDLCTVLIYTNKTGDCLSVCLSVYLFICSAMGGQTARPNGLKVGG